MINLVRSEVLKIRSTQVWIWMLVLSVVFTGLASIAASVDAVDQHKLGAPVNYYNLFTTSTQAGFALMVLGTLGLTTEYRHKTITPTLLATPNRWQLLAGKVASYVVFSVIYSIVCVAVNLLVASIWLSVKGIPVSYGHGVPGGIAKAFLCLVLLGVFGLGIGALLRNQAAAVVFGIVYLVVLNPLLAAIPWIRRVWEYEPGGALRVFASNGAIREAPDDVWHVAPFAGLAILIGWCALVLWAGTSLSLRRDIS